MTPPAARQPFTPQNPVGAHLAGLLLLFGVVVLRVTTATDPFPGWSGDPLDLPSPIFGITPILSLALDAAALVASALLLWRTPLDSVARLCLGAGALGSLWVVYHAAARSGPDVENALPGSAWTAALIAGTAVRSVAMASPLARAAIVGLLLALLPILAIRACVQVWIEHPQTLAEYQASKTEFLAGQGWLPDSPQALAYERRISQPEATGWFGLSNVFGTFFAAGLAASAGGLWALWHRVKPLKCLWLFLPFVASLVGLALTGSKGAPIAAALAIGLGIICLLLSRKASIPLRQTIGTLIGLAAVAAPLGLLVLRGIVGERIGELSLLFRWFYMQASVRIFAQQPLAGTGPGGYKDAYFLAKNPLSPEDISSPHSVFFDFAATLGIGGLFFGAAWMMWALAAGRCAASCAKPAVDMAAQPAISEAAIDAPRLVRVLSLTFAVAVLLAAWLERPVASIESTLVRVAGILLGVWVLRHAISLARTTGIQPLAWAASLGALAVIAHAQIEMTPIQLGSALWCGVAIGLGAAGVAEMRGQPVILANSRTRYRGAFIATPFIAGAATLSAAPGLWAWESALRQAHASTELAGEASLRSKLIAQGRAGGDTWGELAKDLTLALGAPVSPDPARVESAIGYLRLISGEKALTDLQRAALAQPGHLPTVRAASRLAVVLSRSTAPGDPRAARWEGLAIELSERLVERRGGTAASWAWLASLRETLAGTRGDPGSLHAWKQAAEKAPHEPMHWQRLALGLSEAGDAVAAAIAAQRALAADDAVRLDPLRRFTPSQRGELMAIASRPDSP
jgi:hypothetical protein